MKCFKSKKLYLNPGYLAILSAFILMVSAGFILPEKLSKAAVNKDYKVSNFTSVSISIPATVYVEQGSKSSLSIDASDATLDKIEVKVDNGKLIIRTENYARNIREDVVVYITAPDYKAITLSGSVKLYGEKALKMNDIALKISGSGLISLDDMTADKVELKLSGSGKVLFKGDADELDVSIAGSGKLDAVDFKVDAFEGKISGSGDCKVFVTGELDVSIAGSGSILYKGEPQVQSSVSGSGKVRKL